MPRQKRRSRFRSLDECNEALHDLGRLDLRIEAVEARCDKKILEAKSLAAAASGLDRARKLAVEAELEMYYREHLDELEAGGRKTVEIPVGRMGRRRSSELKPQTKKKWADVIEEIKDWEFQDRFLRVTESVDKDAIRAQPERVIGDLGCRLVTKETWWYEVDRTKLETE